MKIQIVTIKKYHGTRQERLSSLLRKFVENIAALTTEYCDMCWKKEGYIDYNLLSNERGSYSLMAAAMHRITPMHQSELGVDRRIDRRRRGNKDRQKTVSGRLDLWSYFEGFEYYFEFKRLYVSPNQIINCTIPKKISVSWTKLKDQISEVSCADVSNHEYEDHENQPFFVGMQTITIRQISKNLKTLESTSDNKFSRSSLRKWSQQLKPEPDVVLAGMVAPKKHRIVPIDWDEDKEIEWQAIPCHLFCFKIIHN